MFRPLHVHLLFWCTLSFITGISISSLAPPYRLPIFWAVLASFFSASLLFFIIKKSLRTAVNLLIIGSFFSAGFYRFAFYIDQYQKEQATLLNKNLSGIAVVQSCPRSAQRFKTCLTLSLISLNDRTLSRPAIVQLYLTKHLSLKPDDVISFKDLTIKKPQNISFAWYLCKQHILGTAYSERLSYKLLKRPSWSFKRYLATKRATIATSVKKSLSDRAYTLFATIFLGKKESTSYYHELRTASTYWGTVHYLARSGFHVAALISLWSFILRLIGFPFLIQQGLLVLLLGVYYLLSWPSISFIRSLITFLLYQGCFISGYSFQMLHLLTITTLIILIVNPLQLFFLDFQLSFSLTCALLLYRETSYQINIIVNKEP